MAELEGHTSKTSQQDTSAEPAIVEVQEKRADEKDVVKVPTAKVQEVSGIGVEQIMVAEPTSAPKETSQVSTTVNVPQQEEKSKVDKVTKEKDHDHHDHHMDISRDPPPQEDAPSEKEIP